jgi:hypothetical protein
MEGLKWEKPTKHNVEIDVDLGEEVFLTPFRGQTREAVIYLEKFLKCFPNALTEYEVNCFKKNIGLWTKTMEVKTTDGSNINVVDVPRSKFYLMVGLCMLCARLEHENTVESLSLVNYIKLKLLLGQRGYQFYCLTVSSIHFIEEVPLSRNPSKLVILYSEVKGFKSQRGNSVYTIPANVPIVWNILTLMRKQIDIAKAFNRDSQDPILFPFRKLKVFMSNHAFNDFLTKTITKYEEYGIFNLHQSRHIFVWLCEMLNVPEKVVKMFLFHSENSKTKSQHYDTILKSYKCLDEEKKKLVDQEFHSGFFKGMKIGDCSTQTYNLGATENNHKIFLNNQSIPNTNVVDILSCINPKKLQYTKLISWLEEFKPLADRLKINLEMRSDSSDQDLAEKLCSFGIHSEGRLCILFLHMSMNGDNVSKSYITNFSSNIRGFGIDVPMEVPDDNNENQRQIKAIKRSIPRNK